MSELNLSLENASKADDGQEVSAILGDLGASAGGATTRVGVRHYVGRRLAAALGEALFECQRFKSKDSEAVSSAEGEIAFIAMYLRKQAGEIAAAAAAAAK